MSDDSKIEEALIEASMILYKEGGMPDNYWHPDYGWFILDGKCTLSPEQTEKFIKELKTDKK